MKKRNFLAVLASFAVMTSMFGISASAAGTNYNGLSDNSNNTTILKKNLVIENEANIPKSGFTFTATPGTEKPATDSTLAVLAGVDADKIIFDNDNVKDGTGNIEYDAQLSTENVSGVTITPSFPDAEHYTATKETTLDFSNCGFTEPGVYRYIITETKADGFANTGITNDSNNTRTIDVYVYDDTTESGKKLKIAGYVMYVGTVTDGSSNTTTPNETTDSDFLEDGTTNKKSNTAEVENAVKSVGFVNTYDTSDLTFGKEVTGNQGSKDKYFEFTVNISNAVAGTKYTVDVTSKADATSGTNAATIAANANKTNVTEITVNDEGTAETKFYLQDGQYITIQGLAKDTVYSVTENAEDYKSTEGTETVAVEAVGNYGDPDYVAEKLYNDPVSGTVASDDIYTGYTNDRSGTIPTGVILSVAAPVVIGLAVLGGIVFLVIRNKKRENEDEED